MKGIYTEEPPWIAIKPDRGNMWEVTNNLESKWKSRSQFDAYVNRCYMGIRNYGKSLNYTSKLVEQQ